MNNKYSVVKNKKSGKIVCLDFKDDKYNFKPKVKKNNTIEVNKIVFISPELTEKILKKKINNKISKLLLELNTIYDEDDGGEARYRDKYMEAEKLKQLIMNTYQKYLGKAYTALTIKKMQIILDGYRIKLSEVNRVKAYETEKKGKRK